MEKLNYVSRISALLLVFVLVGLTGCGSTPQAGGGQSDGGSGTEDGGAAQLATDLGKAASGGTVTLTGRARLATALTVPVGVTLDLTADGAALELQDGAVLTVNGTVNATGHGDHGEGWVEGSLRMGDGVAIINGSGTIRLASKGRLLSIWGGDGKRHLTLDGVTLAGLEDNDASLVEVSEGGEFVLKSGAITGNTRNSDDWANGGGVAVYKGTFTMEGGAISGNSASGKDGAGGGGVQIGEESVFTMTGGEVSSNSATGNEWAEGGGVEVDKGTFTMTGGAITGNTVTSGEGVSGGGVRAGEGSVFTMSGGTISGNTAQGGNDASGGGVQIDEGSVFTLEGGTISGNTAQGGKEDGGGGGVRVDGGSTFTMKSGAISGNTAKSINDWGIGGGVRAGGQGTTFTMESGEISGNTAQGRDWSEGGGVEMDRGALLTLKGGTIYGRFDTLPAGVDKSFANNAKGGVSLSVYIGAAPKWGTGGTYTRGGVSQTGGSDIVRIVPNDTVGTDDTLIAIPAK